MKVEDLRIIDVVRSDDFQSELKEKLEAMRNTREKARTGHGNRLAAHPIDFFIQSGKWNAGDMSEQFAAVLDKKANLPRSKRDFVIEICVPVFKKVMRRLIDNEKNRMKRRKRQGKSVTLSVTTQHQQNNE